MSSPHPRSRKFGQYTGYHTPKKTRSLSFDSPRSDTNRGESIPCVSSSGQENKPKSVKKKASLAQLMSMEKLLTQKDTDLNLAAMENRQLKETITTLTQQIQQLDLELSESRQEVESMREERERLKADRESLCDQLQEIVSNKAQDEQKLLDHHISLQHVRLSVATKDEEIGHLQKQLEDLHDIITERRCTHDVGTMTDTDLHTPRDSDTPRGSHTPQAIRTPSRTLPIASSEGASTSQPRLIAESILCVTPTPRLAQAVHTPVLRTPVRYAQRTPSKHSMTHPHGARPKVLHRQGAHYTHVTQDDDSDSSDDLMEIEASQLKPGGSPCDMLNTPLILRPSPSINKLRAWLKQTPARPARMLRSEPVSPKEHQSGTPPVRRQSTDTDPTPQDDIFSMLTEV